MLATNGNGLRFRILRESLAYAHANRARFVAELKDFIRFPSVSAQPTHAADLKNCAAWIADHLQRVGLEKITSCARNVIPSCMPNRVERLESQQS